VIKTFSAALRWTCSNTARRAGAALRGRSLGCTLRPVELRKPQPALAAFFVLKHSPANLDPPLERRLNSHISAVLSVATRWWPSVKLARCRRLATETLWAICARFACSDATGRCGLSKYCMKQCSGADGSGNLKLGRADSPMWLPVPHTRSCQGFRRKPAGRHLDSFTDGHHLIATPIASNLCVSSERVTTFRGGSRFEGLIILWR
jgi:hypothetical protein